ncbi:hypothetical protein ACMSFI_03290, partial [Bacteroides thetaiotaomicron]|uniref:hypothetical protein n=2 Tax=Bacteroides thetaiotaomicron TaxID=818 RepID=UPI0039C12FD1
ATLLTRQDFNEFFFTHFLHSLFSGKDRDLKIQRQRVLYRGLTNDASFLFISFLLFIFFDDIIINLGLLIIDCFLLPV